MLFIASITEFPMEIFVGICFGIYWSIRFNK